MINTLKRMLNLETKDLNTRIKERVDNLQVCTERLELRKENLFRVESARDLKAITQKITRAAEKRDDLITVAAELRKLTVFQHMKDEQVFRLSKFARIEGFVGGDLRLSVTKTSRWTSTSSATAASRSARRPRSVRRSSARCCRTTFSAR